MTTHSSDLDSEFSPRESGVVRQGVALLVIVAICMAAAALGSLATMPNIPTWYAGLEKPAFTPPNAVFAPVWTFLYLLMAAAAWVVWRSDAIEADKRSALLAFAVQLVLNVAWSWAFFGLHSPLLGLAVIVLLLLAILWTIGAFRIVSSTAAWMMAPYLAWVTFATALNAGIYVLNG